MPDRFSLLELDDFVPPADELTDRFAPGSEGAARATSRPLTSLPPTPARPPTARQVSPSPAAPPRDAIGPRPADLFRVHVSYAPVPPMAELKKLFPGGVSVVFDGREWEKHASCVGMDETPGEKDFWLAVPPADLLDDSEKIIRWADSLGFRPAIHVEAYEASFVHPELHQPWPRQTIALGSFALSDDSRSVAVLRTDSDGRILHDDWFDGRWNADNCFLLVRK